ncbi:MAG: hypothetical protein DRQ40_04730 [Gammaproteobacteria bacterium]|nr:MAG: hypothetical protein DRQ40_04730 [Gammaproteobacteria bacterium]
MKKPLLLHWSSSKPNFGDALSPIICEAVSGRKIKYAKPSQCDLIAIGSLMQRIRENLFTKRIHIWGTGFIEEQKPYNSKHIYHAVRGKHSKYTVTNSKPIALGDPGLLADLLIDKIISKKYKIGFIEHYKDKNNRTISHIVEKYPDTTTIDIYLPPLTFLERVAECEIIFSSAMHGLIVADSLGIPNAWVKLSDNLRGGNFKFQDYYSIFEMDAQSTILDINNILITAKSVADKYHRPNIDEIKKQLYASFPHDT